MSKRPACRTLSLGGHLGGSHTASLLKTQRHGCDPGSGHHHCHWTPGHQRADKRAPQACVCQSTAGATENAPPCSHLPNAPGAGHGPAFLPSLPARAWEPWAPAHMMPQKGCRTGVAVPCAPRALSRKYLVWQELEMACPTDRRLPWCRSVSSRSSCQEHHGIGDRDPKVTLGLADESVRCRGRITTGKKDPGQGTPVGLSW